MPTNEEMRYAYYCPELDKVFLNRFDFMNTFSFRFNDWRFDWGDDGYMVIFEAVLLGEL